MTAPLGWIVMVKALAIPAQLVWLIRDRYGRTFALMLHLCFDGD